MDGIERKIEPVEKGQTSQLMGKTRRPDTKRINRFRLARSGEINENKNRGGEPKRGQDRTETKNIIRRWMPREENAREKTELILQCPKCQKLYSEECRFGTTGGYYNCDQEGHIARNCKNNTAKATESAPHGRPNARVYRLNKKFIEAGPSTSVSGQFFVPKLNIFFAH